jgi:hypothetical protein
MEDGLQWHEIYTKFKLISITGSKFRLQAHSHDDTLNLFHNQISIFI